MAAASLGALEPFNSTTTEWTTYENVFTAFLLANAIDAPQGNAPDRRKAVLLAYIGTKTVHLLESLCVPGTIANRTYDELLTLLRDHFRPQRTVYANARLFRSRHQRPNESVAEFVADLRRLVGKCEYDSAHIDRQLIEQLTEGLKNESHRKKIVERLDAMTANNRTFANAVEIASRLEAAEADVRRSATDKPEKPSSSLTVNAAGPSAYAGRGSRHGRGGGGRPYFGGGGPRHDQASAAPHSSTPTPRNTHPPCDRCGLTNHLKSECRHASKTCSSCGKTGHLARVCRSTRKDPSAQPAKGANAHHVAESSNDEFNYSSGVFGVNSIGTAPIAVNFGVEGVNVTLQLDTGAPTTIIPTSLWHRLGSPALTRRPDMFSCTSDSLRVLGEWRPRVTYKQQAKKLTCVVASSIRTALCGREWIDAFELLDFSGVQAVSPKLSSTLADLLDEYDDLFKPELGRMRDFKATLYVKPDAHYRVHKPRPVPIALKPKIDMELDRLVEHGVLERTDTAPFGAVPIVPVLKPNGSIRVCADFKVGINRHVDMQRYPLPLIDEVLVTLQGGERFSKIDLADAYLQVEVEESARDYLVITTHRGLFRYKRLPFGLSSAVGIFQCAIESVIKNLPRTCAYLDDIIVTGTSDEQHIAQLRCLFERLRRSGLRLKREKCSFMADRIEYLGNVITKDGVQPSPKKLAAVIDAPSPKNLSQLESFLGLVNYYGRFIPNLATLAAPLNALRRKEARFEWTPACANAFGKLKEELTSPRVLIHYDEQREVVLATDASSYGVGAVISHREDDGTDRPIAFASRTLNVHEQNYSQIEREGLAVVFGVLHFQKYLLGRHFTIQTDHQPLVKLFGGTTALSPTAVSRVHRWAVILQAYDFDIVHRSGKSNGNADGLSRLPLDIAGTTAAHEDADVSAVQQEFFDVLPVSAANIAAATQKDTRLQQAIRSTLYGWPDACNDAAIKPFYQRREELTVQDDCLLWGQRVVIPEPLRPKILDVLHESHVGVVRMKALARSYVWWPLIDDDIERIARECSACAQLKADPKDAPLHSWQWPERPWQRLHVDHAGPFLSHDFLIVVDAHSGYPFVVPVTNLSSTSTINALYEIFSQFGLPEQIVSDNGGAYVAEDFAQFCKSLGIQHIRSSAYHPATNGRAERFVRTFKTALTTMKDERGTLTQKLHKFLFSYRTTPQTTTGRTPASLIFGRQIRSILSLVQPSVQKHVDKEQHRQQTSHDAHAKLRSFKVGDSVFVRHFVGAKKWRAGVIMAEGTGPLTYDVQVGDEVLRRHIDHLLPNYTAQRTDVSIDQERRATDELLDDVTVQEKGPPPAAPPVDNEPHAQAPEPVITQPLPVRSEASTSKDTRDTPPQPPQLPQLPQPPPLRVSQRTRKAPDRFGDFEYTKPITRKKN